MKKFLFLFLFFFLFLLNQSFASQYFYRPNIGTHLLSIDALYSDYSFRPQNQDSIIYSSVDYTHIDTQLSYGYSFEEGHVFGGKIAYSSGGVNSSDLGESILISGFKDFEIFYQGKYKNFFYDFNIFLGHENRKINETNYAASTGRNYWSSSIGFEFTNNLGLNYSYTSAPFVSISNNNIFESGLLFSELHKFIIYFEFGENWVNGFTIGQVIQNKYVHSSFSDRLKLIDYGYYTVIKNVIEGEILFKFGHQEMISDFSVYDGFNRTITSLGYRRTF